MLWTGGWDSTFRLLQLLVIQKNRVQPYYLIDAGRPSTGIEIKTMRDIKQRLFEEFPHTRELLVPTRYMEIADIKPDRTISEAFQLILEEKPLGRQYDWISRFCKQFGIGEIELCIHRDDKAHDVIAPFVKEFQEEQSSFHRLDEDDTRISEREHLLFQYFRFPIFNLTKLDMADIAEEHNWSALMNMTWFCHHPRRERTPCGKCKPCIYAMEEGLGWRIPKSRRFLHYVGKVAYVRVWRKGTVAIMQRMKAIFSSS